MQNLDKDWNAIAKAVGSAGEDAKNALINVRASYAEALKLIELFEEWSESDGLGPVDFRKVVRSKIYKYRHNE